MPQIPVTVFTGFLGSGKTTIIRNLIKQFPLNYKMCLLKNEYGDVNVDSLLLKESNIKVTEMINGCLCCVLVGKLQNAILELLKKYTPDRIIIETSGSAFPAPIALEINKLNRFIKLDGIINVVDVLNYKSYKDLSFTAKIQSEFNDLIILNKCELVNENVIDKVLDSINDLNSITPKIRSKKGFVDKKFIFGIQSIIDLSKEINTQDHDNEFDIIEMSTPKTILKDKFEDLLKTLPKWDFYRIKASITDNNNIIIYNYVFGRWEKLIVKFEASYNLSKALFIGKNLEYHQTKLLKQLSIDKTDIKLIKRNYN